MTQVLDDELFGKALQAAARRSKVRINTEEMVTALRADSALAIAPVREFDRTPATDLPDGTDVAFLYLDNNDPKIPAGFYRVRVSAPVTQLGKVRGTTQLIDRQGRVALELPADVDVKSMTLPDPRPFPHTGINVETRFADPDSFPPDPQPLLIVVIICPNGVVIVVVFP